MEARAELSDVLSEEEWGGTNTWYLRDFNRKWRNHEQNFLIMHCGQYLGSVGVSGVPRSRRGWLTSCGCYGPGARPGASRGWGTGPESNQRWVLRVLINQRWVLPGAGQRVGWGAQVQVMRGESDLWRCWPEMGKYASNASNFSWVDIFKMLQKLHGWLFFKCLNTRGIIWLW